MSHWYDDTNNARNITTVCLFSAWQHCLSVCLSSVTYHSREM